MADRLRCEFLLVRYVPDVVKGEFVNIGVVLREVAGARAEVSTRVRFTRDWGRVRCIDKDADTGLLEALEQEIEQRLRDGVNAHETKAVMEVLGDTLSNSLQMSEPRATLAENLAAEMELLMGMYVEPMKVTRARTLSGRAGMLAGMRTEFDRVGAWRLMRKRIAASAYTRAGDPLRIDCGYKALGGEGLVRMFQAVSLEGDVEAAKVLAYSAPQLREGVGRVEHARLELTAVVEPLRAVVDEGDEDVERYRFGVETMERQEIRVVTLADLARVAATAGRELGL